MGSARAPRRSDGRRRVPAHRPGLRLAVPLCLTGVLVLGPTAVSFADEHERAFPTRDEVTAAEERVADRARDVGAIRASLLLADQRLEEAAVAAEIAAEEYHGATWRLGLAEQELADARREAAASRRTVAAQRDEIGALVASSYQHAGQLTALHALVGADGPEGVLDQYVTFQGVSDTLQAGYDRYAASYALARSFEEHAERVRVKAETLAEEARVAKEGAEQAAAAAQLTAAGIADEKERLIRELAAAQGISVSLARQRQAALEEIARERAAARDRAEAERRAREQRRADRAAAAAAAERARAEQEASDAAAGARAEREAAQAAQAAGEQAAREREAREAREREAREAQEARDREAATPTFSTPQPASPPPAPAPSLPPPPPGGSGGATQAIAFAKAQLGEPYVWGAAGPDAWDCSGLMLQAWAQAGVALPHYSAAQYYAGTPVSASSLRPGDLVFWGTTSSPDSIHHVAMYLGDGQIVHAPRTGRPVSIDSMYYWTPPNFFARV